MRSVQFVDGPDPAESSIMTRTRPSIPRVVHRVTPCRLELARWVPAISLFTFNFLSFPCQKSPFCRISNQLMDRLAAPLPELQTDNLSFTLLVEPIRMVDVSARLKRGSSPRTSMPSSSCQSPHSTFRRGPLLSFTGPPFETTVILIPPSSENSITCVV